MDGYWAITILCLILVILPSAFLLIKYPFLIRIQRDKPIPFEEQILFWKKGDNIYCFYPYSKHPEVFRLVRWDSSGCFVSTVKYGQLLIPKKDIITNLSLQLRRSNDTYRERMDQYVKEAEMFQKSEGFDIIRDVEK